MVSMLAPCEWDAFEKRVQKLRNHLYNNRDRILNEEIGGIDKPSAAMQKLGEGVCQTDRVMSLSAKDVHFVFGADIWIIHIEAP